MPGQIRSSLLFSLLLPFPLFALTIGQKDVLLISLTACLFLVAYPVGAGDPNDPAYRRLRYVRYADDVLFGFLGPREEAEQIKQELGTFLQTTLKLELSQEKTLITHAQTQAARFLGYDLQVRYCNDKFAGDGYRRLNANVVLRVPIEVIEKKRKLYQQGGKLLRRHSLAACSEVDFIQIFQTTCSN